MISSNVIADTGLSVTQLGLGCASLAGIFSPVPANQARATVDAALAADIGYFDTAPFYGHGLSERLTGDQLRGKDYVLSTKVGRLLKPGRLSDPGAWVQALPFTPVFDYSYDAIMRSFEHSLQRLGLDRIDILYMHDIGSLTHGEAAASLFRTAMDGGYKALDELRRGGQVKAIGLGVNETQVCLDALGHGDWDVFLLAGRYTLLEQTPLDELFPACQRANTDVVVGGPFNSGVLVGGTTFEYGAIPAKVADRVQAIQKVCAAHRVELPTVALKFCRSHPIVKSVVPGPRSAEELAQILAWWNADVPHRLWADLKDQGLLRADAPVPTEEN